MGSLEVGRQVASFPLPPFTTGDLFSGSITHNNENGQIASIWKTSIAPPETKEWLLYNSI